MKYLFHGNRKKWFFLITVIGVCVVWVERLSAHEMQSFLLSQQTKINDGQINYLNLCSPTLNNDGDFNKSQSSEEVITQNASIDLISDDRLSASGFDISGVMPHLLISRGAYTEAARLLQISLASYEDEYGPGPEHISAEATRNDLALVYQILGRYTDAENLLQQSLELAKQRSGSNEGNIAYLFNRLASLYISAERYQEAEICLQRVSEITERGSSIGPFPMSDATSLNNSGASSLNNLASLYISMGSYSEAEILLQQALSKIESLPHLGRFPIHANSTLSTVLDNLVLLHIIQGTPLEALNFLERRLELEELTQGDNSRPAPYDRYSKYLFSEVKILDMAINLHLHSLSDSSKTAQLALDAILMAKENQTYYNIDLLEQFGNNLEDSRGYDFLNRFIETLANFTYSEEVSDLPAQIGNNRASLARPYAYLSRAASIQAQIENITELLNIELIRINLELRQSSVQDGQAPSKGIYPTPLISPRSADIQAALPRNSALIEFVQYQPINSAVSRNERLGKVHYAAYVLHQDYIVAIDLGAADVIDSSIKTFSDSLSSPNTPLRQSKDSSNALYRLLMQRVQSVLGDVKTLFVSPYGALNLVPFEALVDESDNYLIKDYQFRYLTSGRDLMRFKSVVASDKPALLIGNPTYRLRGNFAEQEEDRTIEAIFPSLPATQVEVNLIAAKLPDARVYTQSDATEEIIKQQAQPSILHIATHGFFNPAEDFFDPAENLFNPLLIINPLLQSGLVLSGVVDRQSGLGQDGILSALEITGIDLRGTQLVVLSACDTGRGELTASEEFYGLRRALMLAGSHSQVITLWKVDDTATQELMVDYYDRLLSGTPRDAALRETQLAFLNSEEYNHPYYWAAFIGSGDWRPLQ